MLITALVKWTSVLAAHSQLKGPSHAQDLSVRWAEMIETVTQAQGLDAISRLTQLKKSQSWESRSAALVAAASSHPDLAIKWAMEHLSDPALMVRLSAVRVLGDLKAEQSVAALWAALEDPAHYRNGKSLFIRRRIVESLGEIARVSSKISVSRFESLEDDSDPLVRQSASAVVARLRTSTRVFAR